MFAHSGKHDETLVGNNVSATMFPIVCPGLKFSNFRACTSQLPEYPNARFQLCLPVRLIDLGLLTVLPAIDYAYVIRPNPGSTYSYTVCHLDITMTYYRDSFKAMYTHTNIKISRNCQFPQTRFYMLSYEIEASSVCCKWQHSIL